MLKLVLHKWEEMGWREDCDVVTHQMKPRFFNLGLDTSENIS